MYRCVVVPLKENEGVEVTDNRILRKDETHKRTQRRKTFCCALNK